MGTLMEPFHPISGGFRRIAERKDEDRDAHGNEPRALGRSDGATGRAHRREQLAADSRGTVSEGAAMTVLAPPQMITPRDEGDVQADPVRRYMVPAFTDRDPEWPSHPNATRDSLHEADMWAVEGLTHRYPTKVLAELLSTCPQYCGHCTRMDLVGNSTPQIAKYKFEIKQPDRHRLILEYLRKTPSVR